MQVLIAIAEDLIAVSSAYELAWIGVEEGENALDKILQLLDEENRKGPAGARRWISEKFGTIGIAKILDKLGVRYQKQNSLQTLIDQWFEFREIATIKPKARPLELARNIMEQANQIEATPEKLCEVEPLVRDCERLMRYVVYFYASELLKCGDIDTTTDRDHSSQLLHVHDVGAALEQLDLGQLCSLLARDKKLKSRPYHPNCREQIQLSGESAGAILTKLPSFLSGQLGKDGPAIKEFSASVAQLLSYWHSPTNVLPKGAVAFETQMSMFVSKLTCYDELTNTVVVTGVNAAIAVGDDVLLASTEKKEAWAPDLHPLPKDEAWVTKEIKPMSDEAGTAARFIGTWIGTKRNKIFISYSRADSRWADRVRVHLRLLERQGVLDLWSDHRIQPGDDWKLEIRKALDSTKVAILLISADFLVSDFVNTEEIPRLLQAAEADGAKIIPLIVSPSRFESVGTLSRFQAANNPARPLSGLAKDKQEQILVDLAMAVEKQFKS